jgi:HTH-type transcriptional regulator / antitoxin HigA
MATDRTSTRNPGDMLRSLLKDRGWTYDDLAFVTGRAKRVINDIVLGKAGITPDTATAFAAAFGNTAEEWLRAEAEYRLSFVEIDSPDIERRARLFSAAPIREMQRRGWISETNDLSQLEAELSEFFETKGTSFSVATRRSADLPCLSLGENAWVFRARQLASTLLVTAPFSEARIPSARAELRRLAAHPKEGKYIPTALAEFGIRFVVVEPFAGCRIDGAAFWDANGPVIAVSIRHDRMDGFWFTLMHEFSHVAHGDPLSVDTEMVDPVLGVTVKLVQDEAELRADAEAASSLIPSREMGSFINRIGPLYSRDRIIQFANRIRIHPGIIVGQLQYRKEIGYSAQRDLLSKIRDNVTATALTDGWGQSISPSVVRRPNL